MNDELQNGVFALALQICGQLCGNCYMFYYDFYFWRRNIHTTYIYQFRFFIKIRNRKRDERKKEKKMFANEFKQKKNFIDYEMHANFYAVYVKYSTDSCFIALVKCVYDDVLINNTSFAEIITDNIHTHTTPTVRLTHWITHPKPKEYSVI